MTQARELYSKISRELDRATRIRNDLKAELDAALAAKNRLTEQLTALAMALLPEAAAAMPGRFARYAQAEAASREGVEAASAALSEAREAENKLQLDHASAVQEFGESAETKRRAMIDSPDYKDAVAGLAVADRKLKANELLLRSAEQKLARLTELARQNPVHALLLSGEANPPSGHFLLSMLDIAGSRIRSMDWYRRADADRRGAEALLTEKIRTRDEAEAIVARHRSVIEDAKASLDESLRPDRDALERMKKTADEARAEREKAEADMSRAELSRRTVRDLTDPAARADLADLVALLSDPAPRDAADQETLNGLRRVPGVGPRLVEAERTASEMAQAKLSIIEIRERLEAAESAADELESVRRKMKRSGMSGSSRRVENVESFMSSDNTGGFDLGSLVVLAAVSDAVSDSSPPSSSSDWSSSSSSFD